MCNQKNEQIGTLGEQFIAQRVQLGIDFDDAWDEWQALQKELEFLIVEQQPKDELLVQSVRQTSEECAEECNERHQTLDNSTASPSKGEVRSHWVIDGENTTGWIHTHGMDLFDLPELEIRDCPAFLAEFAVWIVQSVSDYMLESGEVVEAGERMQISSNTVIGFAEAEPIPGHEDHYGAYRLRIVEAAPICDECGRQPD
jgi:hypothetical protein